MSARGGQGPGAQKPGIRGGRPGLAGSPGPESRPEREAEGQEAWPDGQEAWPEAQSKEAWLEAQDRKPSLPR